jgi:hypothetical protein
MEQVNRRRTGRVSEPFAVNAVDFLEMGIVRQHALAPGFYACCGDNRVGGR